MNLPARPDISGAEKEPLLTVADRVHKLLDRLTPAEHKAARVLLDNYPLIGLESLGKVAAGAKVSHPTVLRFVNKLGYDGYPAFQSALRAELKSRLQSPLSKRSTYGLRGDAPDFLQNFADAVCSNVQQGIGSLPRQQFENVLAMLADPSQPIYLLGGRITDAIAQYFYMHLRVLRSGVNQITGPSISWPDYLVDLDSTKRLIVFDVRRYQPDVVQFAQEAARRDCHVVLFTDQWLSPIASVAKDVFIAHIDVPSNWDSMSAMMAQVEALIAALNYRDWPRLEPRMQEHEAVRMHYQRVIKPPS